MSVFLVVVERGGASKMVVGEPSKKRLKRTIKDEPNSKYIGLDDEQESDEDSLNLKNFKKKEK